MLFRSDMQFDAYQALRDAAVERGLTTLFFQELARKRLEFVSKSRGKPLWPNENYVIKNIRLVFSVTRAGSFDDKVLVENLNELRETLRVSLRAASLPAFSMGADELINFLWPVLNPESMFTGGEFPLLHYDDGRSIKSQLTAFGHHARVKPNEILFGPSKIGRASCRERV